LWTLLHPGGPVLTDTKSEAWTQIGFQGNDPATDFRGMGVYGLDDLTYLARHHAHFASYILKLSHDPISWFSMAIVGINLSAYVISLLRTRRLQWVLYKYTPTRETVHEVYCWVWVRFVEHWTGQDAPLTIMDFEQEFKKVQRKCEEEL
ncbi:Engulfment/cell motility, partial [Catenaria anguillulae PL171]